MRADKWLWHARFFKTRGLATKLISAGHLRVNSDKVAKPAHGVGPGDVLTFPQGRRIRVVRITALSDRRGPAPEAQTLYEDLTPEEEKRPPAPRFEGKGRPSGKDRRNARLYDPTRLD
ncbi:RNA-binding S4 domain-containing protein [Aliiroseovarius sp.]|uniref:RNA-binding S4 domain-containing protein n=1 Tax=Aliiroseovarius sp. TaxID=1872442 RepID=UPI00263033F2|nr:RNA-binding S4 domain-containing protein [Aliiroseovarius sp.]